MIFLILVLFFLGIYNFAFKKNKTNVNQENSQTKKIIEEQTTVNNPTPKVDKIIKITNDSVIGAVYNKKDDSIVYYSAEDGTTWKINLNGESKQQISKTKVLGLKNVHWSPDRRKVLTTLEKDGKNLFYQYDSETQVAVSLKEGLDTAVWDNMSSKIFYKYYDATTKQRSLNIANPDGSGWQKLADVEFRNLKIAQIPLTSIVSYWNSPNANEETVLSKVGISSDKPMEIFSGKYGADYLWSPNGSLALISSLIEKESGKITLGTVDFTGNYIDLNIPTVVSKSVWSSDNKTIYYALASGIPENAIMPNDYLDNKFYTKDTFWKMDIVTGKKERIVEPEEINGNYDSTDMFLSPVEDALFFTNRIDKKLYKIEF